MRLLPEVQVTLLREECAYLYITKAGLLMAQSSMTQISVVNQSALYSVMARLLPV